MATTYPRIEKIRIESTGVLNSTVIFTVIINIANASLATITIEDPSGADKVTSANMTKDDDNIYTYFWNSTEGDNTGTYVATIKIGDGTSTIEKEIRLDMHRPFDTSDAR